MSADLAVSSQPVAVLYHAHHGWLVSWLRLKLGNAFDAADLAHDTFVRIISGRDAASIREPRDYLVTIARGLLADRYRRLAVERAYLDTLAAKPIESVISVERRAIILESLYAIATMLDGLGARTRQIFLLSQIDGLSYVEIGTQVGVSVTTVKNHMVRALAHCLSLVED